jgi:hypothetical protein
MQVATPVFRKTSGILSGPFPALFEKHIPRSGKLNVPIKTHFLLNKNLYAPKLTRTGDDYLRGRDLRSNVELRRIYVEEVLGQQQVGAESTADWSCLPRDLLAQCSVTGLIPEHARDPAATTSGRCRRHDHHVLLADNLLDGALAQRRSRRCVEPPPACPSPQDHAAGNFCHCAGLLNPLQFHNEMRNAVTHARDWGRTLRPEALTRLRAVFGVPEGGEITKELMYRAIYDTPVSLIAPGVPVQIPPMFLDRNLLLDIHNALRLYLGHPSRAADE